LPSFSIHPSTGSGRTEKDGKALQSGHCKSKSVRPEPFGCGSPEPFDYAQESRSRKAQESPVEECKSKSVRPELVEVERLRRALSKNVKVNPFVLSLSKDEWIYFGPKIL
jgi:hypothetical protein